MNIDIIDQYLKNVSCVPCHYFLKQLKQWHKEPSFKYANDINECTNMTIITVTLPRIEGFRVDEGIVSANNVNKTTMASTTVRIYPILTPDLIGKKNVTNVNTAVITVGTIMIIM